MKSGAQVHSLRALHRKISERIVNERERERESEIEREQGGESSLEVS